MLGLRLNHVSKRGPWWYIPSYIQSNILLTQSVIKHYLIWYQNDRCKIQIRIWITKDTPYSHSQTIYGVSFWERNCKIYFVPMIQINFVIPNKIKLNINLLHPQFVMNPASTILFTVMVTEPALYYSEVTWVPEITSNSIVHSISSAE